MTTTGPAPAPHNNHETTAAIRPVPHNNHETTTGIRPVPHGDRETTAGIRPVQHSDRETGAYLAAPAGTTFQPAVDATRIATSAITGATAAAVAIAIAIAVRRPPTIGAVTMGPGGWVSVKSTPVPPLRDGTHRPWWARLLRAHRLVATPQPFVARRSPRQ